MELTFVPAGKGKEIVQIDDARITYKNFSGRGSKYNREGDRNFALIIPNDELAEQLIEHGWNVRIKPPREEGEEPFRYLNVKVKFNGFGPRIYLQTNGKVNELDEVTCGLLDDIPIQNVYLDIRSSNWEVNGKTGISAYLQSIKVVQRVTDRFASEMYEEEV